MHSPVERAFADWQVGDSSRFSVVVDASLVQAFAELSGDTNPLHTNQDFAVGEGFNGVVAHGMISGAMFSRLIGMYIPGKYALYLSQTLAFKRPILFGTTVFVKGEIVQKVESMKVLKIHTSVTGKDDKVFVEGDAMVRALH